MPSLNISLPAPLREWIEAQIKGGRYGNASEYLRELIRRDQERQAQERLERLLLDGIESGTASPLTKKDWAELRTEVAERLEKRRGGRGKSHADKRPQAIRDLADIAVHSPKKAEAATSPSAFSMPQKPASSS